MSPRVTDGMIDVGGEKVPALDAAIGHLRWRYRSGPGYTGPPPVAAGAACVGYHHFGADAGQPGRGTYRLHALDPATEQVRWAYPGRNSRGEADLPISTSAPTIADQCTVS
ncbi:MAG: hypothetical protein ACR2MP_10190 [Streptosporangiaceae bacterium]